MNDTQKSDSPKVGILDFLFTVSIAIGFVPDWFGITWSKGFFDEEWVVNTRFPSGSETLDLFVFSIGLFTLVFSWYGYYKTLNKHPHRDFSGILRFMIDVLLIIIYALMLLHYDKILIVLFLLFVVHSLYFTWDILKVMGWMQVKSEPPHGI